jgi:hypothetical protein
MEKELTAAEVRKLPEFSKVTIHGRDKHGYPTRTLCFVHELPNGRKVLHPMGLLSEGFVEIRKRTKYTMEVENDGNAQG